MFIIIILSCFFEDFFLAERKYSCLDSQYLTILLYVAQMCVFQSLHDTNITVLYTYNWDSCITLLILLHMWSISGLACWNGLMSVMVSVCRVSEENPRFCIILYLQEETYNTSEIAIHFLYTEKHECYENYIHNQKLPDQSHYDKSNTISFYIMQYIDFNGY